MALLAIRQKHCHDHGFSLQAGYTNDRSYKPYYMDRRAILRMGMGFYILWSLLLEPVYEIHVLWAYQKYREPPEDHINISIVQNMISGIPLLLVLGTRV